MMEATSRQIACWSCPEICRRSGRMSSPRSSRNAWVTNSEVTFLRQRNRTVRILGTIHLRHDAELGECMASLILAPKELR